MGVEERMRGASVSNSWQTNYLLFIQLKYSSPLIIRKDFNEVLNFSVSLTDRILLGKRFHSFGATWEKALPPYLFSYLVSCSLKVLSESPYWINQLISFGAFCFRQLCVINKILYTHLNFTFNQWYFSKTSSIHPDGIFVLLTSLAALFCTLWSFFIKLALIP